MFALFIILIFTGTAFVKCEIEALGCPKVTVVEDFQLSEYLGKWYEYSKYPFIFEFGGKCVSAEYSLNDDGTVKVVNSMQKSQGKNSSVEGKATFAETPNIAKLKVKFPQAPVDGSYWVLDTDYTRYAVVYSCTSFFGLINFQLAWILTRDRHPEQEIIETALAVLKKNGVSTKPLKVTDQSNC